jgi:hypothetical protein
MRDETKTKNPAAGLKRITRFKEAQIANGAKATKALRFIVFGNLTPAAHSGSRLCAAGFRRLCYYRNITALRTGYTFVPNIV